MSADPIVVRSLDDAQKLDLSYPVEVRPNFSFRGQGLGIAFDRLALIGLVKVGLDASPMGEVHISAAPQDAGYAKCNLGFVHPLERRGP